ncbi:MAG TPA: amidohydrolase family protein [Spirochaetia bacterium]|nr:amidohydrolase family protein [Spirochaetia bacterium]
MPASVTRYQSRLDLPIIDGYVHMDHPDEPVEELMGQLRSVGVTRWVFLESIFCDHLGVNTQNPLGIWLKHRFPDTVYFFASADHRILPITPLRDQPDTMPLDEMVRIYAGLGIDGWKSVIGKPDRYAVPLDAPGLEFLYTELEKRGLPLFLHVGDPIEFWDPRAIPDWALPEWAYDASRPSLEELRRQAEAVLSRHPRLVVIFAHFFFMGYELDRAAALMTRYPGAHLDLTPGVEMFFGLGASKARSREFFAQYADRIHVGSYGSFSRSAVSVISMIRRFLETDDVFDPPHEDPYMWPDRRAPLRGLGLPRETLEAIYSRGLERLIGKMPRHLDETAAIGELERLSKLREPGALADTILARW